VRSVGSGPPIEVVPCQVKYPQGAEKMLIEALTGVQVPGGKLPLHVGVVVNNVGTMAAVDDWFRRGQPLIERVVTVSGPGVSQPANLMVPLGTSLRVLLEACGGVAPDAALVVMGGPMMGQPAPSLDVPVVKGTSGLLVFRERDLEALEELPCIRCGRCLEACACFLNPSILGRLARKERWEAMAEHNLMDCMECGACSFTCPSRIPLVQQFRVAKAQLRRIAARDKQRGGA
jgi:electron transport complex protein RnfC